MSRGLNQYPMVTNVQCNSELFENMHVTKTYNEFKDANRFVKSNCLDAFMSQLIVSPEQNSG